MTHFWRGLKKHLVGCKKHEKIEKVTGSQDDDFVGVLKKNIPNKLAQSQVKFSRRFGTKLLNRSFSHPPMIDHPRLRRSTTMAEKSA